MAETRATDVLPDPDNSDGTGVRRGQGATTSTSRWQKVVGIIGLVVLLWVGSDTYDVVVDDSGGGSGGGTEEEHGPSQDSPVEDQDQEIDSDDGGVHTPPAGGDG